MEPEVSGTRGIDHHRTRHLFLGNLHSEGLSTMTLSPEAVRRTGAPTREEFSERLLRGSVKKSYETVVDIDWDAPLDPDKYFLPPKTVSLYGTPVWDAMSRAEQIELSRQTLVNHMAAVDVWR